MAGATWDTGNGWPLIAQLGSTAASGFYLIALETAHGMTKWARTGVSLSGQTICTALAVDHGGNAFCAGRFGPTVDLGGADTFASACTSESCPSTGGLAKYDADGQPSWLTRFERGYADSLAVSQDGLSFAVLHDSCDGGCDFGTGISTVPGTSTMLVGFNSQGAAAWVRYPVALVPDASAFFSAVRVDAAGDPYVAGTIAGGPVMIGNKISAQGRGTLLAKLNAAGDTTWVLTSTGDNVRYLPGSTGFSLGVGGTVIVVGTAFMTSIDFGHGVVLPWSDSANDVASFLVKYR
jgi:hypothetical protein